MTNDDRLRVSLRLKAGRFLAGSRQTEGKQKKAVALSTGELAARAQLRENGITKNRLEDIEQMEVDARPMELDRIAAALNLPAAWFSPEGEQTSTETLQQKAVEALQALLSAGQALPPTEGERPPSETGRDHPLGSAGESDV